MFKSKSKTKEADQPSPKADDKHKERRGSVKSLISFGRRESRADSAIASPAVDSNAFGHEEDDKELVKSLPPLLKTLFAGEKEKFKEQLGKKKVDIAQTDRKYNRNLFHWAAIQNKADYARIVIDFNHKDTLAAVNARDVDGRTALCWAVIAKRLDLLRVLISESTESINFTDRFGRTPLFHAVSNDDVATCTILILRGAQLNIKNEKGDHILLDAIQDNHTETAMVLVANNCDIQVRDTNQRSALHHAVLVQSLELCKALHDRGCDANEPDSFGKSALDYAGEAMEDARQDQSARNPADGKTVTELIYNMLRYGAGSQKSTRISTASLPSSQKNSARIPPEILVEQATLNRNSVAETSNKNMASRGTLRADAQTNKRNTLMMMATSEDDYVAINPISRSRRPSMNNLLIPAAIGQKQHLDTVAASDIIVDEAGTPANDMFGSNNDSLTDPSRKASKQDINAPNQLKVQQTDLRQRLSSSPDPLAVEKALRAEESRQNVREVITNMLHMLIMSEQVELPDVMDDENEPDVVANGVGKLIEKLQTLTQEKEELDREASQMATEYEQLLQQAKQQPVNGGGHSTEAIQALQREIEQLNAELEDSETQHADQLKQLQQQLQQISKSKTAESQKLSDLENECLEQGEQVAELQTQVVNLSKNLQVKEVQVLELEADIADEKQQKEQFLVDHQKLIKLNNELKQQIESMSGIVEASKKVVTTDDIANYMKQIKAKDEENAKLSKKMYLMQSQFEETERSLRAELHSGNQKLSEFKEQTMLKERDHIDSNQKSTSNSAHHSLSEIKEEVLSSKEQLYLELNAELDSAQSRLTNEVATRKQREQELQNALQIIEDLKSEYKLARTTPSAQNNRRESDLSGEDKQQLQKLRQQLDQTEQRLKNELSVKEALQLDMKQLQSQTENLQSVLGKERIQRMNTEKTFRMTEQTLNETKSSLVQLKQYQVQAQKELDILRGSSEGSSQSSDYLLLLRAQLDDERAMRSLIEAEMVKSQGMFVEMDSDLLELRRLFGDQSQYLSTICEQLNFAKNQNVELVAARSAANSKCLDYENQINELTALVSKHEQIVAEKAQLIEQQRTREGHLTEGIAQLTRDLNKCKSDLLSTERNMFENSQKDKAELKALDQQLKDKIKSVENRDKLLAQAKEEFDTLKRDLFETKKKYEVDLERTKLDGSMAITERDELKSTNSVLQQRLAAIQNAKNTADERSQQLLAQLDQLKQIQANQAQTLSQNSDLDNKYKFMTAEYEKLLDQAQLLQKKLAKTESELGEQTKALQNAFAERKEMETEKNIMISETVKFQQKINEEQHLRKELEDAINSCAKSFEDFSVQREKLSSKIPGRGSNRDSVSLDSQVQKLNTLWQELDEVINTIEGFKSALATTSNNVVADKDVALKNMFKSLLHCVDQRVLQTSLTVMDRLSQTHSNILQEVLAEHGQQARSLQDQVKSSELAAQLKELQADQIALENQKQRMQMQFEHEISKSATQILQYESLIGTLKTALEENANTIALFEKTNYDQQDKISHLELQAERCGQLQIQVNQYEKELARISDENVQLEQLYDQMFVELNGNPPQLDRLLTASTHNESPMVVDAVAQLPRPYTPQDNPQTTVANRQRMSARERKESLDHASKVKLQNQIMDLSTQLKQVKEEHETKVAGLQHAKHDMEQKFQAEVVDFQQQIDTNRKLLHKFESLIKRMNVDSRTGDADQVAVRLALTKLEHLQEERSKIEKFRNLNEKRLKEQHQKQILEIMRDLQYSKDQLEKMTGAYNNTKAELNRIKHQLAGTTMTEQQKLKMQEQLAEARVLLQYKHRMSTTT